MRIESVTTILTLNLDINVNVNRNYADSTISWRSISNSQLPIRGGRSCVATACANAIITLCLFAQRLPLGEGRDLNIDQYFLFFLNQLRGL
ncbi:hypothetical protein [Nostoc sp. FACHB-110]|uniref:hypothetical protein n=1 Tax=Nostoc sp. FACHB-110 TaxID=2692834 RepID=UPI0016835992|nr:hypothetical protein [Nostoc sp. FACHB-110]MBD2436524.1 hypothetical protein [Nostoc sp. FACHB-110]